MTLSQNNPVLHPTVGVSPVRAILGHLLAQGVSEARIQAVMGDYSVYLSDPEIRIPAEYLKHWWAFAIAETGDTALGLTLGSQDDADMSIVGHLVLNSETLRVGLEHFACFFSVVNEGVSLALSEEGNTAALTIIHHFPEYYCIADVERSFVLALSRARRWLGRALPLISIHFQHAAPKYADQYARCFPCPVYFNQGESKILFESRYLALPGARISKSLKVAALAYVDNLRQTFQSVSFSEHVRRLIYQHLEFDEPDIKRIAKGLNMSKQTLYRKLKGEGVVFQKLVEQVRFDKARQLLAQSRLSASEIAFHLGFSELSAFSRAFKRWSGLSPKAYREQLAV